MIKNFVEATGDNNPIHTHDTVARAVGLPGRVAHGKLIQSIGINLIRENEARFGIPILLTETWQCGGRPVFPGEHVYVRYHKPERLRINRIANIEVTIIVVEPPTGAESIAWTGSIQVMIKKWPDVPFIPA